MIGDSEFAAVRQKYYGLLVRLLWKEPEPEFIRSLEEGIEERAEEAVEIAPLMAEGWRAIRRYLKEKDPAEAADEFTEVFIGPHAADVTPYESYYLTGGLYRQPLVGVRQFMGRAGLVKKEGELSEPEDFLAFELEIMNWLVGKQIEAETEEAEEQWIELQADFLKTHLLVWAPECAKDLENARHAVLFRGIGKVLRGFLEMEKESFQDRGPERVETLAEARKRLGGEKAFKGPMMDFTPPESNPDPVK